MTSLDKAAIMCPAPGRPLRDPHGACHCLAGVRCNPSRSPALSVPKTQGVSGTSSAGFNRLRVNKPAAEAKRYAAVGDNLETIENPAFHRSKEWERHHAR